MFQLTLDEVNYLSRCNFCTTIMQSKGIKGGRVTLPYVFTEQGIYMLMTVLKGELATSQSKALIRLFKKMRHYLGETDKIFNRVSSIEERIDTKFLQYDKNFSKIFKVLDSSPESIKQGIFFQGQIYDAYSEFQKLIQKAKKEIILIDNYIDLTVLDRFTKKNAAVTVIIYTRKDTTVTELDVRKFNAQYSSLEIKYTDTMHDRFLILDNKEIYHIGASLKDLGKKCFAFTRLEDAQLMIKTILAAL